MSVLVSEGTKRFGGEHTRALGTLTYGFFLRRGVERGEMKNVDEELKWKKVMGIEKDLNIIEVKVNEEKKKTMNR